MRESKRCFRMSSNFVYILYSYLRRLLKNLATVELIFFFFFLTGIEKKILTCSSQRLILFQMHFSSVKLCKLGQNYMAWHACYIVFYGYDRVCNCVYNSFTWKHENIYLLLFVKLYCLKCTKHANENKTYVYVFKNSL